MAGLKLVTDLDPDKALRVAWRSAQDAGFSLPLLEDDGKSFRAQKGNLVWSLLVGGLAPRCHFLISVERYDSGTEVILEENRPWMNTGMLGISKVHRQAEELIQTIADGLMREGGRVLERKEF